MNRRQFLASSAAAALLPSVASAQAKASDGAIHGVNLGGWLALEKWISPAVYAGVEAEDEYTLCQKLGRSRAADRLKRHRETWITEQDFAWLGERGINSVRLPVNYGVAEENLPFVPAWDTVEFAFRTAAKRGIRVLLDLHGAPGSQNGWDHSGRAGTLGWHRDPANVAHTIRIVEDLAARCKAFDNLLGIELLNEPRWDVPMDVLKSYYQQGYARVRKHLPAERAAVVINDGFRPLEWAGFMQEPEYRNVLLDTHMYQCYTDEDRKRDGRQQVSFALLDRRKQLDAMQKQLPCIVGEWSCALDPASLKGLKGFDERMAVRAFGDAQLMTYGSTRGWFFWTYKTAGGGGWSFRDCVQRGAMPDRYGAA
jgi:glucan 1,3-beta-glucosidase